MTKTDPVLIMDVKAGGSGENSELAALSNELGKCRLRIESLEAEFKKLREEADGYKKELDEKTEALATQEKFYNEALSKNEQLEKDLDTIKEDTRALAVEAKRLEDEMAEKDDQLNKLKAAFAIIQQEKSDIENSYESLKVSSTKNIEDLKRQYVESEIKYDKLKAEYDSLKAKFDSIIKGGENLDNVTKKYYSDLEAQLAEAKMKYEELK